MAVWKRTAGGTGGTGGGSRRRGGGGSSTAVGTGDGTVRDRQVVDSGAEVAKAYAPYAIIVAIFSFTNLPAVKEALAVEPWTYKFAWPGLDVLTTAGEAQGLRDFAFEPLGAVDEAQEKLLRCGRACRSHGMRSSRLRAFVPTDSWLPLLSGRLRISR